MLGFAPRAVGGWWAEAGGEIDVVALGEHEALLGECKWSSHPVGVDVLDALIRKGEAFRRDEDIRRGGAPRLRYAIFSRSGFSPEFLARAAAEGVLAHDLAELERGNP